MPHWYMPTGEWNSLAGPGHFAISLPVFADLPAEAGDEPADHILTRLRPRNGVKMKSIRELVNWLGPQAWKLQHPVRLIEFFGGTQHRVSREAASRGHVAITLGIAHGQDLRGKRALRLSKALLDYTCPPDILVAWVCTPWSAWATFNERKGDLKGTDMGDRIRRQRQEGLQYISLFHILWRRQLAGSRHATGENPWTSRAFLEAPFLSGQFPRESWWGCLDQCQIGLAPPWPNGQHQRHQKRTCFVSSRSQLAQNLSLCCDEGCRARYEHVPLAGSWKGRALTSWAEDYPPRLAQLLCDSMEIYPEPDATALPAHDEGEPSYILDQATVDVLNSITDGTHQAEDFTSAELDFLEVNAGLRIHQLHAGPPGYPETPEGKQYRYRTIFVRDGPEHHWTDLEGTVLLATRPPEPAGEELLLPGTRWVVCFGEPLLRVRARGLPQDATEAEAMAWLRRFHVGTHHASPAEMAQAIEDAGGSKSLCRLALQYKCPICAVDEMPGSRARSAIPLAARSFNSVLIIDVVDIKLERQDTPQVSLYVLVCVDAFSSYGMGFVLEDLHSATILRHLVDGWFSTFGAPRRLYSDGFLSFISTEWHDAMARWGVLATTSAAHAPWQHGKVEVYNQRVRRFARAVWRSLGAHPDVTPKETIQLTFQGRNEMDLTAAGVPPCQAALGYRPRRFFGEEWDQDWSPMTSDPGSIYERDVKVRAAAREAVLREQTRSRIDRAVCSKPMALRVYEPGTVVQIFRSTTQGGGRHYGRWLGPALILATESAHNGRVPRIVHIAYRNRTYMCAPEQVRPISAEAWSARRALDAVPELRPEDPGRVRYDRDLRPEARYLTGEDDEEMSRSYPEERHDASSVMDDESEASSSWLGPAASKIPRIDEPPDNDELFMDDDEPPNVADEISDEEFENELQSIQQALEARRNAADQADDMAVDADDSVYHAAEAYFASEDLPDTHPSSVASRPSIAIEVDASWDEVLRGGRRAIEEVVESCHVASVARKRRCEVSYRQLSARERLGMRAAKKKEFAQWLSSSVLNLAAAKGVPHARIVRCRWVLTFKKVEANPAAPLNEVKDFNLPDEQVKEDFTDLGDGRLCKARLVILGYEDPDIGQYATYAPTARRDSKGWLFAVAAHRGWQLHSLDAKAAFLNGRASARPRPIYLDLPADCAEYLRRVYGEEAGPRELYKAAYGLGEAPLAWFELLCDTMVKVGLVQLSADRCMFVLRGAAPGARPWPAHYPKDYGSLPILGVLVVHVDDLLLCGEGPEWREVLTRLKAALPFGAGKSGHFLYVGEMICQDLASGTVRVHQQDHVKAVTEVPTKGLSPNEPLTPYQVTEGKGRIGSLLYVATSTRPDLCFEVSHIGSRMNPGAVKQDLLDCNKAVRRAHATEDRGLTFRKVADDWKDVVLCVFSDAGWATRPSKHSQAGGLHFLAHRRLLEGEVSSSCLLDWVSTKITWITGNPYEAEAHSCRINAEVAEHLQFFHHELISYAPLSVEMFLRLPPSSRWPCVIVIDNKGLYTQVDLNKMDKRKTIYVMVLFELLTRTGSAVYWVNSGHELADPLTKLPGEAQDTLAALEYALATGQIRISYDTESYRKSMQKRAMEVRTVSYAGLNISQAGNDDFDVPHRGSLQCDR